MYALRFLLCFFQDCLEFLYLLLGCAPGGDEAADGVVMVSLTEMGEGNVCGKTTGKVVWEDYELLVGGRIDIEGEAFTAE